MEHRLLYSSLFIVLGLFLELNVCAAQILIPFRVFQLQTEAQVQLQKCPVEDCMKFCEETYSPHTYEKTDEHLICKRGCRLFAVIDHTSDDHESNKTLQKCSGACAESYPKEEELSVCLAGCKKQSALVAEVKPQPEQEGEDGSSMMMAHQIPLAYDQVFRSMVDQMESMFNKMIQEDLAEAHGPMTIIRIRTFVQPGGPDMLNSQYFPTADGEAQKDQLQAGAVVGDTEEDQTGSTDASYLSCLKLSLPRFLMLAVLLLCSIFLLWLACSSLETAPKQRPGSHKVLKVNSDDCELLSYEDAVKKSLKPTSIPEGRPLIILPREMFEAGPLPAKSRL